MVKVMHGDAALAGGTEHAARSARQIAHSQRMAAMMSFAPGEDGEQIRLHGQGRVELGFRISAMCRPRIARLAYSSGSGCASAMVWASRSAQPR